IIEEIAHAPSLASRSYRFAQALLQDVVYQNILLQRRREMHGSVAAALQRRFGEQPQKLEQLIELGHHFGLSDKPGLGAHYLFEAGERARMIFANADAIRLYERALA